MLQQKCLAHVLRNATAASEGEQGKRGQGRVYGQRLAGVCQELMADFTAFSWHWNICGKGQVLVTDAAGRKQGKLRELLSQHGHLVVMNDVYR